VCVCAECVCECVRKRERERARARKRERKGGDAILTHFYTLQLFNINKRMVLGLGEVIH